MARGVAVYAMLREAAVSVIVAVNSDGGVVSAGASETTASPERTLLLLTLTYAWLGCGV